MKLGQVGEIAFEIVVAIDDEERGLTVELRAEVLDRAGGAQERWLEGVRELDVPPRSVPAIVRQDLGTMVEIHEDFSDTALRYHFEHSIDHRTATDGQHGLRDRGGDCAQARAPARGKNN